MVLSLLATSAATLVAAILTLVPPLDHRLERNRLNELRHLASTARFGVRRVPSDQLEQGSPSARRLVADLQRRTGGRVALYAADGESLADTDPARRVPGTTEPERLEEQRLAKRSGVRSGVRNGDAVVVTDVRARGGDRLTLVLRKPLGDTRAAAGVVRSAVPPAAGVGAGVALLMALALSSGLLRRLRRLRDDARALSAKGLGHPVEVGPADEVGEVAGALETMRGRLVEGEAARQNFLATASHELRTPLATLQGTLELLQESIEDPTADRSEAGARTRDALRHTHRLVTLTTDLLDLNRLDGEVPLTAEPVELFELVLAMRGEVGAALASEGRSFELRGDPPQHALADPVATLRVLRILVDNARAYGEGTVRIAIAPRGADVEVCVSDEGPGLAAAERERIFERFERGDAGRDRPGFGLGLALARGLAERMAGTVAVRPVSRGACFGLQLPGWSPERDASSLIPVPWPSTSSSAPAAR